MRHISHRLFTRIFFRTYLVGAAFNMRGLQNVGFAYIIDPGLKAIHPGKEELRLARSRYVRHYNCHPFWTPLVAGIFLHMESAIASRRMPVQALDAIKDTAVNTLSALGDSVFGGTLLVTWGLSMAGLIMAGMPNVALVLSALLFVALQIFKISTFTIGLRYGFSALLWVRRWNLINWGDRFKNLNALLLLTVLFYCMQPQATPGMWSLCFFAILFSVWLVVRLHIPRTLLAVIATSAILLTV